MGWWGTGVLEGDEPSDVVGFVCDELLEGVVQSAEDATVSYSDYEQEQDRLTHIVTEKLKAGEHISIAIDISNGVNSWGWCDSNIALQALGEMVMRRGGLMTDELRVKCREAAENDKWAQTSDGRKASINSYISRLDVYGVIMVKLSDTDEEDS